MATEQGLLDHAMAVRFVNEYISLCEKEIWGMETEKENGVEVSDYLLSGLKITHIELCRVAGCLDRIRYRVEVV